METALTNENQLQNTNELKPNDKKVFGFFNVNWKINVVDDNEAPVLYSRRAIYFFTIAWSVFFGGTLMFLNLRKLKNKQGQISVAIYSILYGVITTAILMQFKRNTIITLLVSMLGSYALFNYFWEKYIGSQTKYKPKSIWKPLTITIVIFVLIMIFVIANIESIE